MDHTVSNVAKNSSLILGPKILFYFLLKVVQFYTLHVNPWSILNYVVQGVKFTSEFFFTSLFHFFNYYYFFNLHPIASVTFVEEMVLPLSTCFCAPVKISWAWFLPVTAPDGNPCFCVFYFDPLLSAHSILLSIATEHPTLGRLLTFQNIEKFLSEFS